MFAVALIGGLKILIWFVLRRGLPLVILQFHVFHCTLFCVSICLSGGFNISISSSFITVLESVFVVTFNVIKDLKSGCLLVSQSCGWVSVLIIFNH